MAHVSGYDAFAPVYDAMAAVMTEDVPFYVELAAASRRRRRPECTPPGPHLSGPPLPGRERREDSPR